MRKERFKTKLLRRITALVLTVTLAVGSTCSANALFVGGSISNGSYLEYAQKAVLYASLGDTDAGTRYFNQLVQQEPENLAAYVGRAEYRKYLGDIVGARQDCDYAIGHLTNEVLENVDVRLYGYSARSETDFYLGDQALYLSDAQNAIQTMNLLMEQVGTMYSSGVADSAGWQELKAQAAAEQSELNSWYNNGNPARSFQTEHANVTGGVGDTVVQLNESWSGDESSSEATYNTTFHLSQPIQKVVRRGATGNYSLMYLMVSGGSDSGAVAFFVPAGTTVTMEQTTQIGRERAKNYTTFSVKELGASQSTDSSCLTVEAGKIYQLDYAASDSLQVYFIAG